MTSPAASSAAVRPALNALPRPSPAFGALFERYARGLVGRNFSTFWLRGQLSPPGPPVVYLLNHSAWWDAIVAVLLSRSAPGVLHSALMGEAGYQRFPFFRKLGAVPVPPADETRAMLALFRALEQRAAAEPCQFWIFPQGAQRHPERRPLGFARGAELLVRRLGPKVQVVPIALRYEFGEPQHAELFASIGTPLPAGARPTTADLEALLTSELDGLLRDRIADRRTGFRAYVSGAPSVSDRWSGVKRALRWAHGEPGGDGGDGG